MELSEALRTKRATRQFKDTPLPDETIRAILDAGRRAPSAANAQHWTFIAIRDKETQLALSKLGTPGASHLAGAALVVVLASNGTFAPPYWLGISPALPPTWSLPRGTWE